MAETILWNEKKRPTFFMQSQNWVKLWKIVPVSGTAEYYTSHDENICTHVLGEDARQLYLATEGVDGSDTQRSYGMKPGTASLSGAISGINLGKLEGGYYNLATVYEYKVDARWPDLPRANKAVYFVVRTTCSEEHWTLEVEDIGRRLQDLHGTAFCATCKWSLGRDEKGVAGRGCGRDRSAQTDGVYINIATYTYTGCQVQIVSSTQCADRRKSFAVNMTTATRSSGSARDLPLKAPWTGGRVIWTTGDNAGQVHDIHLYEQGHGRSTATESYAFHLATPTWFDIDIGDQCTIEEGCDYTFETCQNVYKNQLNFGGFPKIPGPSSNRRDSKVKWY